MNKKMGRSIEKIMSERSPERRKRIRDMADKEIREYKGLQEFRKAIGWTQEELARN